MCQREIFLMISWVGFRFILVFKYMFAGLSFFCTDLGLFLCFLRFCCAFPAVLYLLLGFALRSTKEISRKISSNIRNIGNI